MKLSIIVPIYNCETYLPKCIESIVAQSNNNIEIILVDDGSTDSSLQICYKYKKEDSRITVIEKKNGGVSSARNVGLDKCSGEFVMFVDSDDWLEMDACEKIFKELEDNCDLFIWNSTLYDNGSFYPQTKIQRRSSIADVASDIIASPKGQNNYIRAPWAKVFRNNKIRELRFPESFYIGEDACFILSYLSKIDDVKRIKVLDDSWYNYRITNSSAVRKYKPNLLEQSILQLNYITNIVVNQKWDHLKATETALTNFSWGIFVNLKLNEKKGEKNQDCKDWWNKAYKFLSNNAIEYRFLPKVYALCIAVCHIFGQSLGELVAEFIITIYIRKKYHFIL